MIRALATVLALLIAVPASGQTRAEIGPDFAEAGVFAGAIEARLSSDPDPSDATFRTPKVEIRENGAAVLTIGDDQALAERPFAAARLVEMDTGNDTLEVAFSAYSGGAHCCTRVQIATKTAKGWVAVDLGSYDGDGEMLEDADYDGRFELVTVDNAFLYAFDCYACSYAPLRMMAVENGASRDVTTEARFVDRHRAWLEEMTRNASDPQVQSSPGFLVGEVAMRLRVGEGAAAFAEFQRKAQAASLQPIESCPNGAAECAETARKKVPFAEAVGLFLKENGYDY